MSRIYEIIQRIKMIIFIKLNPQWDIHLTFWVKKTFFYEFGGGGPPRPPRHKKEKKYKEGNYIYDKY